MLKLNTTLFHKNLWSLRNNSFSLLERHVCPIQMFSDKPSVRLYQNLMIWHMNSSTGLEDRKRGQLACFSAGNLLMKFASEGNPSSWGKTLGSKVTRNSWHPKQISSDVHCQVDKLVSEKDQLYN